MKKWIGMGVFVILFLAGLLQVDWNRFRKDTLFVEVQAASAVEEMTLENGDVLKRYVYTQLAYTTEGESEEVTFTAGKELREGAYLRLYIKDGDTVTSYDEVSREDVPRPVIRNR